MTQFVDPGKTKSIQLGSKKVGTSLEDIATGELYPYFIKMDFPRHMEFLNAVYTKQNPRTIYDTFIDPKATKAIYLPGGFGEAILQTLLTPEEQEIAFNAARTAGAIDDPDDADLMGDTEFSPTTDTFEDAMVDAIMAAKKDLGLGHHTDFFASEHFKDFCWSIIGTPAQTASRMGVKNAKGQELLGDLSIAVAVRNKTLIAQIGSEFIKHQGTDLTLADIVKGLHGGIKLNERKSATDWRAQAWSNGTFERAVREMLIAGSAKDKKAESFHFGTAFKVVTASIEPSVSKRDVLEEIMARAGDIRAKAKDTEVESGTSQGGAGEPTDDPWKLSVGVINKVDWKKFAEVYDIDIEDESELKDIAMRIVKKSEEAALSSSKSLLTKRTKAKKKRSFNFRHPKHFAAAVLDVMQKRTDGEKLKKPLKASMMTDGEESDA